MSTLQLSAGHCANDGPDHESVARKLMLWPGAGRKWKTSARSATTPITTETAGKSGGTVAALAVALTLRLPKASALASPDADTAEPLSVLPEALFVALTNGRATAPESWLMVPMSWELMSTPAMT